MEQVHVARVLEDADDLCIRIVNELAIPGLAAGIVHGRELVYARGFGFADASRGVPVTPDTVFKIGSASKTFVAVSVLQLAERGLLDLDDLVSDHLTSYPIVPRRGVAQPTIRQALTHTAGVGELRELRGLVRRGGLLAWPTDRPLPALRDYYRWGLRVEVEPGTKWAYANHMFATLGQVVADVAGVPFDRYLRENVFDRLGMATSDLHRTPRVQPRLAVGYRSDLSEGLRPAKARDMVVAGAGSVLSTVNDMARYVVALLNDGEGAGGRLLEPGSVKSAFDAHVVPDPRLSYRQGLSFFVQDFPSARSSRPSAPTQLDSGHRIVYHGGGRTGFISMVMLAPDDDLGVIAFVNSSRGGSYQVTRNLMSRLLDVPLPADAVASTTIPERPDLWGRLIGVYQPTAGLNSSFRPILVSGGEFEIVVHDNHLAIRGLRRGLSTPLRLRRSDPDDPYVYAAVVGGSGYSRDVWEIAFTPEGGDEVDGFNAFVSVPMRFQRRPRYASLRRARTAAVGGAGTATALALAAGARRAWTRRQERRAPATGSRRSSP
ncbi:MAG TPA: serine hydrolase domain-containing protein [Nitriliruptorales bacterium]